MSSQASYALKSSYEFVESPKKKRSENSPHKRQVSAPASSSPAPSLSHSLTPSPSLAPSTPSKLSSFFAGKWDSFTSKASEVAQKAKATLTPVTPAAPAPTPIEYYDLAYPPWEHLNTTDTQVETNVSTLILELANNSRHVLIPPPDELASSFDFSAWLPVILAALSKSTKLSEMRSTLVPAELDEESFWRNYFFRVNTLKRAFNLSEAPQLKENAQLPKLSELKLALSSFGSSSDGLSSSNLSRSSSLVTESGIDNKTQDIATAQTLSSENTKQDRNDATAIGASDDQRDVNENDKSTGSDFFDPDDPASWSIATDFVDSSSFASKITPVPEDILKALED